jgi:hypothetical protein
MMGDAFLHMNHPDNLQQIADDSFLALPKGIGSLESDPSDYPYWDNEAPHRLAIAKHILDAVGKKSESTPKNEFKLPTPPPGMKWHREDGWTADMLPSGTRPLYLGETINVCDKCCHTNLSSYWGDCLGFYDQPATPERYSTFSQDRANDYFFRTTRPLTFTYEGHEWTWHRPGDPMPCDGEREVWVIGEDHRVCHHACHRPSKAKTWVWKNTTKPYIIGWRYADESPKETIPTSISDTAKSIVAGDRAKDYGDASESFARIAALWSAWKGVEFTSWDVAMMMILLKVSRAKTSKKQDTLIDIIGYAECAEKVGGSASDQTPRTQDHE